MQKVLALLLLAILPLTPSWAGVVVTCPGDAPPAVVAPAAGADEAPECCGSAEVHDLQCGSDCTGCHGSALPALTGLPPGMGLLEADTGDCTHACRIAAPLPSAPLRPPSGVAA